MIISFAATTGAMLAGEKTVTRRFWSRKHAEHFHDKQEVDAYDKSPRNGGKRVAIVKLTAEPVLEPLSFMTDDDYAAEGFGWLDNNELWPIKDPWGLFLPGGHYDRQGVPITTWRDYFRMARREVTGQQFWTVRFTVVHRA